jgi:hypothetical protein
LGGLLNRKEFEMAELGMFALVWFLGFLGGYVFHAKMSRPTKHAPDRMESGEKI